LLSISTILIISLSAYSSAKESIKRSIFDRLNVAITLKKIKIDRWFQAQRQDILLLASLPETLNRSELLLANRNTNGSDLTRIKELREQIAPYFEEIGARKPNLKDISILTEGGIVIFSTNEKIENMYQPLGSTTTYFTESQVDIDPTFYVSPASNKTAITFAVPIFDEQNKRIAVLSATLDLKQIDELIRETTGLGETGQTYLVGRLEQQNAFIESEPFNSIQNNNDVRSVAIDAAIQGKSGSGLYRSYEDAPVIGIYNWLDKYDLALIAEIDQEEAFAPARALATNIILIGATSIGLLLIGIYWVSRRITRPIIAIADAALEFEKGNLSYRVAIEDEDEIGILAQEFNQMAQRIGDAFMAMEVSNRALEQQVKKGGEDSTDPQVGTEEVAKAHSITVRDAFKKSEGVAKQHDLDDIDRLESTSNSDIIAGRYRIISREDFDDSRQNFLAKDTKYLNEPTCAIEQFQIPSESQFTTAVGALFEAEVHALEVMGRSEVAPRLLAFFEAPHSSFIIVRESFEGITLDEELSKCQPLSLTDSLELLIRLLRLLEIVHLSGLIHQDIQPRTIIFHPQRRRYILTNLGLRARIQARIGSLQGKQYSLQQEYIAPEQKTGQAVQGSDLYALGLIVLQALTGKPPRDLSIDSNSGEIVWRHLVKVNESVANVLNKLVCQDYEKRYGKIRDVLRDLDEVPEVRAILHKTPSRSKLKLDSTLE